MAAEKERLLTKTASEEEERIRKKIEKLQNREKKKKERQKQPDTPTVENQTTPSAPLFKKGDMVSLPNKAVGEILELDNKNAVIALGNLRTNVRLTQLKKVSASQAKKINRPQQQASYVNIRENISQKRMTFKPDIDLRGTRGEEALQRVITFLDEAVMLN